MVKVILDEKQYGKAGQINADLPLYNFYMIVKDGEEFITQRHGDGTELVAVTKAQYKGWKNLEIVSKVKEELGM